MDNTKKLRNETHWAEHLDCGDHVLATLRHPTDGTKNKINVEVIVISNNRRTSKIKGMRGRLVYTIPYNELKLK